MEIVQKKLATDFLEFLFYKTPRDHFAAITEYYTTEETYTQTHFIKLADIERVADRALTLCKKNSSDVYIRTTALKTIPAKGRGKKSHTSGTSVLWVDIDAKQHQSLDEILNKLRNFYPQPSWVNLSGSGVHAYWGLEEFATDILGIEKRTLWLMRQLGGDNCWSVAQIMRIPGTANFKTGIAKPVVPYDDLCSGKLYKWSDFKEEQLQVEAIAAEFDVESEPLPENFLDVLPVKLKERILTGEHAKRQLDGSVDKSENDWYIAMSLLELGYLPGQVLTVLSHDEWFSGNKTRTTGGYSYAMYTVAVAAAHIAQRCAYQQEVPLLEPVLNEVLWFHNKQGVLTKKAIMRGGDLVEPVIRHLMNHGVRFFHDPIENLGYIAANTGDVFPAENDNNTFKNWVYQISGFTDVEHEHRLIKSGLAIHATSRGETCQPCNWCHHDPESHSVYIMLDHKGRNVLKVMPGTQPTVCMNGTDHYLLRRSGLCTKEIQWVAQASPKEAITLIHDLITSHIPGDRITKGIITCYLLAMPLAQGMPIQTFPLLHLTGGAGSGKSQTLGLLSTFLHGTPQLLNATPAASYRAAQREIFLPFDDYENITDDVRQFILTASTGNTRQKSGKGSDDVVNQAAHILMGLTSINLLEEETARRRAFVLPLNKNKFFSGTYHEHHWKKISNARSIMWSGYAWWLAKTVLPSPLMQNFNGLVKEMEAAMTVDTFKGLASYLTLMYIIGKHFNDIVPGILGTEDYEHQFKDVIKQWQKTLCLDDPDEISDRNPLLIGLQHVFESARRGPEGEVFRFKYEDRSNGVDLTKVVQTILRDKDFRVHAVKAEKVPTYGEWFGLQGTTTEWLTTIWACDRWCSIRSPKQLGWAFSRLVGVLQIPPGTKESECVEVNNMVFQKLQDIGAGGTSNGWRVLVRLDHFSSDE